MWLVSRGQTALWLACVGALFALALALALA
jgi:hypothetical protein